MSKRCGSSNTSGSWFAAMYQSATLSPSLDRLRRGSRRRRARCGACTSPATRTGASRRRRSRQQLGVVERAAPAGRGSRCSASIPCEMRLRVVSLPATASSSKNRSNSMSLSRSPSTSAWSSTLMMSSPGFGPLLGREVVRVREHLDRGVHRVVLGDLRTPGPPSRSSGCSTRTACAGPPGARPSSRRSPGAAARPRRRRRSRTRRAPRCRRRCRARSRAPCRGAARSCAG